MHSQPSISVDNPAFKRPSAIRWTSSSLLKGRRAKCSLEGVSWIDLFEVLPDATSFIDLTEMAKSGSE